MPPGAVLDTARPRRAASRSSGLGLLSCASPPGNSRKSHYVEYYLDEIDDVDWARILATNLTTAFLVCRAFVPALKARRSGRIVNFTSIAARRGSDRVGVHYAAAKGG